MRITGEIGGNVVEGVTIKLRKIIQQGGSYYICLPRNFLIKHKLRKGSEVAVISNDKVQIVVPE